MSDRTTVADAYRTLAWGPAPESAAPAHDWIDAHDGRFGHYIGAAWTAVTGPAFETMNPATGQPIAHIAQGGGSAVDAAVRAARSALPEWSGRDGHDRARFLYAIARLLQKHARVFAVIESLDTGMPIRESRDIDVPLAIRHFQHHVGWAQIVSTSFPDHQPVGVVGQIVARNFPLLVLASRIAPALAAGCTVILKPSEFTSLTALRFAELCAEVGLPAGVVNVVTGDGTTGEALVRHADVDKIAFTGSTDVGRAIRTATAGTGKALSLEMGGRSLFVVFDDADLDSAVEGVVDAIWFDKGQVCCAASRILAQESIAEALTAKLRARVESLRIGDPLDRAVDIGASAAPVQFERIERLVMTFRTPDEGVTLANNTRYGLAASVWTESVSLALHIAARMRAVTVCVNGTNEFDAPPRFGGVRDSGFVRKGGREGMHEYLVPSWLRTPAGEPAGPTSRVRQAPDAPALENGTPALDRTPGLLIGGRLVRPDSGSSLSIVSAAGAVLGAVSRASREDVHNAVAAAQRASGWRDATAHLRSQVLYFVAESIEARASEFAARLRSFGIDGAAADAEVKDAVRAAFTWAAWADRWDGAVHTTPMRNVTLATHEPIGVIGIVCPDATPLAGVLALLLPVIATGNTAVILASESAPLTATDLSQVLATSDLPAGVANMLTGLRSEIVEPLAAHDDVAAIWHFAGDDDGTIERLATGNLKRTWIVTGVDWRGAARRGDSEFLRRATQVRNLFIPYGE